MLKLVSQAPLRALWLATGIVILGRLFDLQWHLTHDEFEGATEQIQAHLVLWIGVLSILLVTAVAVREGAPGLGYRIALGGTLLYVPAAVWHFAEHAGGTDPAAPHFLIGIAYVLILVGVVLATVAYFRRRPGCRVGGPPDARGRERAPRTRVPTE